MNEQCLEQAADWIDRINDLDEAQYVELLQWLNTPQNRQAFSRLAEVFSDPAITYALNEHANNVVHIQPLQGKKSAFISSKIALAASFAVIATLLFYFVAPQQQSQAIIATTTTVNSPSDVQKIKANIGKRLSKILEDGSYLHLNADSEVSAQLLTHARKISLKKGQVFFDVAKDKTRPFIIDSGQVQIKVLGTSFDVERNQDKVIVTVYEGKVLIDAKQQQILIPPQQAIVEDGEITLVNTLNLTQLPLWRTGWLEVSEEPLTHVVEQLQRYTEQPIVINGRLKSQLISGRFKLANPEQSLALIASTYQWQFTQADDGLLLTSH